MTSNLGVTPYDAEFYSDQADGSIASARIIVPILLKLVNPTSVLDIGCGLGTWLSVFIDNGITDVLGIDGSYVDRTKLKIPNNQFLAADLTSPPDLNRTYDLTVCLEVAEHLPNKDSSLLVDYLTKYSSVVLFSAAIPGQGGTNHINEQWPSYWRELFAKKGYIRVDCIRPRILWNNGIEWWYRQNIYLFVKESYLRANSILNYEYTMYNNNNDIHIMHSRVVDGLLSSTSVRGIINKNASKFIESVRRLFL